MLAALVALAARIDAAAAASISETAETAEAAEDPITLAIRYADAITSGVGDAARAPTLAGFDDDADANDEGDDEDDEEDDDDAAVGLDAESADRDRDDDPLLAAIEGDGGRMGDDAQVGAIDSDGNPEDDDARLSTIDTDADREDDDAPAAVVGALGDDDDAQVAGLDVDGTGGAAPDSPGAGALAMLDAELDPGDAVAMGDAAYAGATAGAAERYEQAMRHQRPSPWGRLDVGVAWRLRQSEPMHAPAHRSEELWLVATWRR